jgi:hypothetical protein
MKYLLLVLLTLAGCVPEYNIVPVSKTEVHSSTGIAHQLTWRCQEEDINDKLVWVECDFKNYAPYINNVCINVSYISRQTITEVAGSRQMCTGPLWSNAETANYAAFVKEQREALNKACGPKLVNCYMRSKVMVK